MSEQPFRYFFSGTEPDNYFDIVATMSNTMLISYMHCKKKGKKFLYERFKKRPDLMLFLDSGAHTFFNDVDYYKQKDDEFWDKYLEGYVAFIREHKEHIFVAAELDIDLIVGVEKVAEWRRKYFEPLAKEGIQIVYVWHDVKGMDEWNRMCERYPFIGFSYNEIGDGNDALLNKMFTTAKKYGTKIHGFAVASSDLLQKYPFYTSDSSVAGDSSLLVRKGNKVERIAIEDLYKRYDFMEERTSKTQEYIDLQGQDYEVLSVNEDNEVSWESITSVIKHTVRKPCIKLHLEAGRTLMCTSDHSLIKMGSDGSLMSVKGDSVKPGDCLIAPMPFDNDMDESPYISTYLTPPRRKELEHYMIESNDDFLAFLGMWVGNGHLTSGYAVGLSTPDVECKDIFLRVAKQFGAKVTHSKNGVDMCVSNKILWELMDILGFERCRAHEKKIPSYIFSLSKRQIAVFMRGLFSADGSASGGGIVLSTVSPCLLRDLQILLDMFGMNFSCSTSSTTHKYIGDKEYVVNTLHTITIKDSDSINAYADSIRFIQERKNKSLNELCNKYKGKNQTGSKRYRAIPAELSLTGYVSYPSRPNSNHSVEGAKGSRVSRDANVRHFDERVINANVSFITVKAVEKLPLETVVVYDLSVAGVERFFANGVLVHNSTWLAGTQYGEINIFDGRKLRRQKKDKWKTIYKNHLIKRGANWNLLGREDPYEMQRMCALSFTELEAHVRKVMKAKWYWNRVKHRGVLEMPEEVTEKKPKKKLLLKRPVPAELQPKELSRGTLPEGEWFKGDMEDYMLYVSSLGIDSTLEKEDACVIIKIFHDLIKGENLEDPNIHTTEALYEYCDIFNIPTSEVNTRAKAITRLQIEFGRHAIGERNEFGTREDDGDGGDAAKPSKERDFYPQSPDYITVELSKKECSSILSQFLPEPGVPEEEAQDAIFKEQGIVPVRDERGRLLKGQKTVRKPKLVYDESIMPKFSCNTCYKGADCPHYKPDYVCVFNKEFQKFNVRNIQDVRDAMFSMAEFNMQRVQRLMIFEQMDSGMPDSNLTDLMKVQIDLMERATKLGEASIIATQRTTLTEDGKVETTTELRGNPRSGGILEKIFGKPSSTPTEEDLEDDARPQRRTIDVEAEVVDDE